MYRSEGKKQIAEEAWSISIQDIEALISLFYGSGNYGVRKLSVQILWSRDWGLSVFYDTVSRNKFGEIMCFFRNCMRAVR